MDKHSGTVTNCNVASSTQLRVNSALPANVGVIVPQRLRINSMEVV